MSKKKERERYHWLHTRNTNFSSTAVAGDGWGNSWFLSRSAKERRGLSLRVWPSDKIYHKRWSQKRISERTSSSGNMDNRMSDQEGEKEREGGMGWKSIVGHETHQEVGDKKKTEDGRHQGWEKDVLRLWPGETRRTCIRWHMFSSAGFTGYLQLFTG